MIILMKSRRLCGGAQVVAIAIALLISPAAPAAPAGESGVAAAKAADAVNESNRLFGLGKYDEAIAAAQTALRLQPDNAVAFNNLAVSDAALGHWDPAVEAVRKALRLQPGFNLAVNNLARFLKDKPAPMTSAEIGSTAASWLDLSLAYYQARRYADSVDAAREVIRLQPSNATAYNNLAAAYGSMKMWNEAEQAARDALRLNPDMQLARNNLAWVESERQKTAAEVKQ